jgi:predicted flap endonuclease-1-like 5' DNA nuclease
MFKDQKEILKNLCEMQDQLWKDSMASFPGSAFPRDLNDWQQKTLESISNWAGQAVKQSLELQQEWLDQWSERASGKKLKPKSFAELSNEARQSTQRWLDNQNQLWGQWLQVLRGSSEPGALPSYSDWEKAVEDSIQQQMALLKDWSDMAEFDGLSGKEMTKLANQIVKAMQKSIETQQQLWSHWFNELGVPRTLPGEKSSASSQQPGKASGRSSPKTKKASAKTDLSSDDLKQISGIGPSLEKKLKDNGIKTIRQIAELSNQDMEKLGALSGRIKREKWVQQARKLIS